MTEPGSELVLHPTASTVAAHLRQAQVYVRERLGGASSRDAARAAGTTVKDLKAQGREVQKYLADARSRFSASKEDIREVVLLRWMEKALDADPKVALVALNELSKVPGVGLKESKKVVASPEASLEFDEATNELLDTMDIVDAEIVE